MDGNLTIDHDHDSQGEHGSHVAGIAAANSYIPGEDGYVSALESVKVQGVAPEAQLLVMKVFGAAGGAYDSDYMAAIGSKQVVDGAVAMSVKDGLYDYVICYPYNPGDQYMMAAMDADYHTYRSGVHFVAGYTYRFEMYDNGSYDSARLTITKGAQPADEVKEAAIRFVAGECVRYLALHHTYPDGEPRTIACISRDISQRYNLPIEELDELTAPLKALEEDLSAVLDPRQDLWQDMFYPGSEEENLLAWSFFMLEQQHRLHELPPLALKRRLLTETLTMETGSLDGVNTVEDRIHDLICAYGDRAELLAEQMKIIADPRRMETLMSLKKQGLCGQELAELLHVTPAPCPTT